MRRIPPLKATLRANLLGQGWSAVVQLFFIPIFVRLLGIEGYALIGFYATLQGALQVLDLGLSPTTNRELAQLSAIEGRQRDARDFVYTVQLGYWFLGALIGVGIWASAPWIATHWIHAAPGKEDAIRGAVRLMAVLVMLQWPVSFYAGALMGLHRQPLLNAIRIAWVTIANVGAAFVLDEVSRTVAAFLVWQIVGSALYVCALTIAVHRSLPEAHGSRQMRGDLLLNVWRFAVGMSWITLASLLLTQLDKIILIKLLPLREFGYYALAGTVAGGLVTLIGPIFNAVFPRFSALAAVGDHESIRKLYHAAAQFLAVIVLPVAAVMAIESRAVLYAWTGNQTIASAAWVLVTLLALGTALNGVLHLPHALQLAYGWTSIGVAQSVVLLVLLVPAILFFAPRYGAVAGAGAWLALNVLAMAFVVPITHRRLLRGEASSWFVRDVAVPFATALASAYAVARLVPQGGSRFSSLIDIGLSVIVAGVATAVSMSTTRRWLILHLERLRLLLSAS